MHKLLAIINNPKKLLRVIKYQLMTLIYENKDSAEASYLQHDSELRSDGKLVKELALIADFEQRDYFGSGWLKLDQFLQAHPEIHHGVDIGSGNGWLSARLIREGFESVQAIEPSAAGITIAKTINHDECYQKITWINNLAENGLAKIDYTPKQLFFTGTVLSHLPNNSVEKICQQVNERAALGSILMFEEAWCEKWFDEYHHTRWHVRPKAWWQQQLSNWDLVFDGPSIPGHNRRKLFRGVKVRNYQPSAKPRFSYLDALRGLAVALVLFIHTVGYASAPSWYRNFWMAGKNGVMLFFMISALTLFMSLDHKFSKEKQPLKNFFLRRFFRVAPLYYLGVIFYFWFAYYTGEFLYGIKPTLQIGLANLFFIQGLVPLWANAYVPGGWTISAEFIFYALVPLLYAKIKTANTALWLFIISLILRIGAVGAVRLFLDTSSNFALVEWPYYFFPNQFPIFSLGILLYFLIKEKSASTLKPSTIFISSIFLFLNLALSNTLPTHVLFGLCFLMLIWSMSQKRLILIDNRFFIYLGKISFGVYLAHFAVITCLSQNSLYHYDSLLAGLLRFVVVLGLSSAIASLTYWFVERPMQAVGQKLINKSEE